MALQVLPFLLLKLTWKGQKFEFVFMAIHFQNFTFINFRGNLFSWNPSFAYVSLYIENMFASIHFRDCFDSQILQKINRQRKFGGLHCSSVEPDIPRGNSSYGPWNGTRGNRLLRQSERIVFKAQQAIFVVLLFSCLESQKLLK